MTDIACTLSPADMSRRADEVRAVGRDGLLATSGDGGEAVLRFRPEVRERLARIVVAESECCAFMTFELADEDDAVVLKLSGPEGAEPAVQRFAELFAAD